MTPLPTAWTPAGAPRDDAGEPVSGTVLARTIYEEGGFTEVRAVGARSFRVIDWGTAGRADDDPTLFAVHDRHFTAGSSALRFYRSVLADLEASGCYGTETVAPAPSLLD